MNMHSPSVCPVRRENDPHVLRQANLAAAIVIADAMHTQKATSLPKDICMPVKVEKRHGRMEKRTIMTMIS
jgi:hypothetical protein